MSEFAIIRGEFPCTYCDKAIALLTERGLAHTVTKLPFGELILRQAELNHHTVPIVYVDGAFIGGCDALSDFLSR